MSVNKKLLNVSIFIMYNCAAVKINVLAHMGPPLKCILSE